MGAYETPDYKLISKENEFEIREYSDFYIVEYDNKMDQYSDNGFGTLFSYISQDNQDQAKIKMTIPVFEEVTSKGQKMAFVVPSAHWDKIPKPNNPLLSIKKFEKGSFAVIRYSGTSGKAKEQKMMDNLMAWVDAQGYRKESNFMLAFYNPPFIPPMFRRNEIMVRVSRE
ncbi:SOUL family heme-binding protein [Alkalibacter saccharofermentans]|uniref:SOUL heme-binding protein n=1 Tax=Alkalibacter saccharofermentans DSM 14828 TaxID=1120975 RepID=A0A1M4ZYG9_9FIRM|nr:heme-binding protein [Alkalibacter saccharofermentans]SHF23021.1 SOUL heme-binding protein [Alkalibacter saccharofermentans DSM 14828]